VKIEGDVEEDGEPVARNLFMGTAAALLDFARRRRRAETGLTPTATQFLHLPLPRAKAHGLSCDSHSAAASSMVEPTDLISRLVFDSTRRTIE